MFICIQTQKEKIHIVAYEVHGAIADTYRTYCDREITIKTAATPIKKITTLFAADNTFPGICKNCKSIYDEMYDQDLNYFAADARSSLANHAMIDYFMLKGMPISPKYEAYMYRAYRKLSRAKNKIAARFKDHK